MQFIGGRASPGAAIIELSTTTAANAAAPEEDEDDETCIQRLRRSMRYLGACGISDLASCMMQEKRRKERESRIELERRIIAMTLTRNQGRHFTTVFTAANPE